MYTLDKMDVGSMTDDELAWWMNLAWGIRGGWEGFRATKNRVLISRFWRLSYENEYGQEFSRGVWVTVAFPRVRSIDYKITYGGESAWVKRTMSDSYVEDEVVYAFEQAMLLRAANPSLIYDR